MACDSRLEGGARLLRARRAHSAPALLLSSSLVLASICGCAALRPFDEIATHARFDPDPRAPVQSLALPNVSGYEAAQEEEVWCWAACAVFVRRFSERAGGSAGSGSQEAADEQKALVEKIRHVTATGESSEEAAERSEVVGALNPDLYEQAYKFENEVAGKITANFLIGIFSKKYREAHAGTDSVPRPNPPSLGFDPSRMCRTLANGKPLVAALRSHDGRSGHVVVVIGAEYQTLSDTTGRAETRVLKVKYWDPAKFNPTLTVQQGGEHWEGAREFAKRCDFVASEEDANLYVTFMNTYNQWMLHASGADKDP